MAIAFSGSHFRASRIIEEQGGNAQLVRAFEIALFCPKAISQSIEMPLETSPNSSKIASQSSVATP